MNNLTSQSSDDTNVSQKNIPRREPSSQPEQESVRKVSSCPVHGELSSNKQHGRCWSDISCGLSGCYCVKRKSKINGLLKKILAKKLYPSSSTDKEKGEETWCKRRSQYYQHRRKAEELITEQILKLMKKRDLEVLLSELERKTKATEEAKHPRTESNYVQQQIQEFEYTTENCVNFNICSCETIVESLTELQNTDHVLRQMVSQIPHVMISLMFRWPDLLNEVQLEIICQQNNIHHKTFDEKNTFLLRRHPHTPCSYTNSERNSNPNDVRNYICCNPYHWSRILSDPFPINKEILTDFTIHSKYEDICKLTSDSAISYSTHGTQWDPEQEKDDVKYACGCAKVRIVQVTDVYTLNNFPNLKTFLNECKENEEIYGKTYSMLTGDFLAPYLLSSFDKGAGMMKMINQTPIDYLTWGNHETDLNHSDVMRREKEYKGIWINSNMKSHESFENSTSQVESTIVKITSPDGSNTRSLGMCAVLSNTSGLYKPNAFGGATIDDPWECLKFYNEQLLSEGCDMVLPLCHLYDYQDEKTCNEFDFPIILSGHDHHCVDRTINGTRLLKPGLDANKAIVLDLSWPSADADAIPNIDVELVDITQYPPDEGLLAEVAKAYSVLDPLYKTDLAIIPERYCPISSNGSRQKRVTMATYLCTQLKLALNLDTKADAKNCDCVLVKGGNIRGGRDYEERNLTLESLKSEIKEDQSVGIFLIPGHILECSLKESWEKPNAGWFQYDDGVEVDSDGFVVSIGGSLIDKNKLYRVGSFLDFNANYGSTSIHQYFEEHPEGLPEKDSSIGCHVLLLNLFSQQLWRRIWRLLDVDGDGKITKEEIKLLDKDNDGSISKDEIRHAIEEVLGMSTHEHESLLIDFIMSAGGDADGDGNLTLEELNLKS